MLEAKFCEQQEDQLTKLLGRYVGFEFFTDHFLEFKRWITPWRLAVESLSPKIITIGGSNGKGETAFALAHYLRENGKRFTLWSSPHILTVCERFYSWQGHISYTELGKFIKLQGEQLNTFSPSYYEFLFAIFLEWSCKLEVDYIILEVGLGGRLDAVNILDCDIAAITSISREHTAILGLRYDEILLEKLAITRTTSTLFTTFHLQYLQEKTEKFSRQLGCAYWDLLEKKICHSNDSFSTTNKLLAKEIAKQLECKQFSSPKYLGRGRLEQICYQQQKFIFIGAHNLDGARKLSQLSSLNCDLLLLSFSKRSRKEMGQICKIFSKIEGIKKIILTTFEHPKAASVEDVMWVSNRLGFLFVKNWQELLFSAKVDTILVSGSYYFIGQVQFAIGGAESRFTAN